jgi:hypothetical protein
MKKNLLKFWLCFGFLVSFCLPTQAATTVSISESQSLTFPKMGVPSSGSVYLTVSPLNSITSGTAQIISGTAYRGTYPLSSKGSGGISISIDISGITTDSPGLTLSNFQGFYNGSTISSFPSSTLSLPAKSPGNTPLYLGATVTTLPSVSIGTHTGSFTITVFVQ